jgi:hypothetical protein
MSSAPVRIHLISRMTTLHSASAERPDHPSPTFPYVEQRRRDPVSKPRSRRCFVCGTTGRHPLDFRVCPRTAVLLRRSLATINDNGRLVSPDGSPLPMTRHPGGVAAHLISRFRNPTRVAVEHPRSIPIPVPHIPPHSVSIEPHHRVILPSREFNSSSPHAIPPIELTTPAPEHVPLRHVVPQHDFACLHCRTSFISTLFTVLLDVGLRSTMRAVVSILDSLYAEDPAMFRQRMQPVFTRLSQFPHI